MNQTIIATCRELAEEANAIIKYTEDIEAIGTENPAAAVMTDIRLDELEHVQKLALALSRLLVGDEDDEGEEEPGEAGGEEK